MRGLVIVIALTALLVRGTGPGPSPARDRGRGVNGGQVASGQNAVSREALVELVRRAAHPLTGGERDYDPLMELIGDARFVMLGEATHGTHEFYRERARITRRLIEEKGFGLVVLEADWPDAYRVNRYVLGEGTDASAEEALSGFERFPRWMWRNADFRDFVAWLRAHNESMPAGSTRARIFGMDLYSLTASADAVVTYLKKVDPEAAGRARKRYGCFSLFRRELQEYGYAVATRSHSSCERQAREQFQEMESRAEEAARGGRRNDELLSALQNSRVVMNGEAYYRTIFNRDISSWNLRDAHMAETLESLAAHFDPPGSTPSKVVVWAHNSHQGDARMTERAAAGEHNVGQLMRQRHGEGAVLVGFTTYTGTVRAASEWGRPESRKKVRPALPKSFSALFHETGVPNFLLRLRGGGRVAEELSHFKLERAIGVIYLPESERSSHYFFARLGRQFDAVIHWDVTSAVEPLRR